MRARRKGQPLAVRAAWAAAMVTGAAFAIPSCVPNYDFVAADAGASDASMDSTAPADANVDSTAPADAAMDSTASNDTGPSPSGDAGSDAAPPPTLATLLPMAVVSTETGNAQQQHLVFAKNSGRWWLFYIDADGLSVKTQWSLDFATWTAGAVLTPLPYELGGDARNFSVAYRDFSGIDVIHLATSLHEDPKRVVYDTRATITGSVITFDTPVLVHDIDDVGVPEAGPQGGPYCDPDGTGVAIAGDGHVYVATSWVSIPGCCSCDSNFATSTALDEGTSWNGGFVQPLTHFTVPGSTHARQVSGFSTGAAMGAWETADNEPADPTNVSWAGNIGGAWPPDGTYPIFPNTNPPGGEALNDWSICRIDDQHVHAVRRRLDVPDGGDGGPSNTFDHYFFNGSGWTYEGALADDLGLDGTGVVLLTNGTNLLVAAISGDASSAVRYATYDGTWSAWSTLTTSTAVRNFLSGSGCADPAHPALLWTEGVVAPYAVVGIPVLALIP